MVARIYKPSRTAMQSGTAKAKKWVLEFETDDPKFIEPLMGWTGSHDTLQQVKLYFPTQEAAITYATQKGIPYELTFPHQSRPIIKAYADNFR